MAGTPEHKLTPVLQTQPLLIRAERETLQQQEAAEIGTGLKEVEAAMQGNLLSRLTDWTRGGGALLGLRAQSHKVLKHLC